MKKKSNYHITYNLQDGKPTESILGLDIFEKRDQLSQYPDKEEDKKRSEFPFNINKDDWEIKVFYIDARCIQGFIRIKTLNGIKINPPEIKNQPATNIISIEFIHAKYPVTNNLPYRWRSDFYNQMMGKNQRMIDKAIPEIYDQVRLWERIQVKLNNKNL